MRFGVGRKQERELSNVLLEAKVGLHGSFGSKRRSSHCQVVIHSDKTQLAMMAPSLDKGLSTASTTISFNKSMHRVLIFNDIQMDSPPAHKPMSLRSFFLSWLPLHESASIRCAQWGIQPTDPGCNEMHNESGTC